MSFYSDFNEQIIDINEYFSFTEYIDKIETHKKEKLILSSNAEYIPERKLQKILRANCYILLYNLIESSIRNCILSIYDCIHDEDLPYKQLSEKLQNIWLNHKNSNKNSNKKLLKKLINGILTEESIIFDKNTINISGNLDYENIIKIIDSHGCFGKISVETQIIKSSLAKIKRERNWLAHGNKTFCQSGETVTMSDLITLKENVIAFLSGVLSNVEHYINDKKYRQI